MNQTNYYLPQAIQRQKDHYLHQQTSLSQLFDKIDTIRLFQITQNSVEVNLDNITFGPNQYTITFTSKDDSYYKIIYYCILYFIFQKKYDKDSSKVYNKLLQYIFHNEITISCPQIMLTQEQMKVYLIKFLHILQTSKTRRKVVYQELNSLPQISIIFVLLIKQIVKQQKLIFQKNARQIESLIYKQLQFNFDLLSCQTFLFGGQFKVQIRQFDKNSQFMIFHDSPQEIHRIKQQFYLGESAYFIQQGKKELYGSYQTSLSLRKVSAKIIKKSTMKSIEWSQNQSQTQQNECKQAKRYIKQFEEDLCNSDIQSPQQLTKDVSEISNCNNQVKQKSKILDLNQIVKASFKEQKSHLGFADSTARSTNNNIQFSPKIFTYNANNVYVLRHKNHKQSFDSSHLSTFNFSPNQLNICKSTKEIKRNTLELSRQKCIKQRRVPSFILNRMKEKQIKNQNFQQQVVNQTKTYKKASPRITFSYKFG